jgi:hypothetical protein
MLAMAGDEGALLGTEEEDEPDAVEALFGRLAIEAVTAWRRRLSAKPSLGVSSSVWSGWSSFTNDQR